MMDYDDQGGPAAVTNPSVRGPNKNPRRKWGDQATGPETPTSWKDFNADNSIRALRTASEAACRRILRKLHLLRWHVGATTMVNLLRQAGQPEHVLKMVSEIVETCHICCEWSKPAPASIPSAVVATEFHEQAKIDSMFYKKRVVCHRIDRFTRWDASCEVAHKDMENQIPAIDKIWVALHGPPKELIIDGEAAIVRH